MSQARPSVVSFNTAASALAAAKQWARNLFLFREQQRVRLHLDLISFNTLQHALALAARWQLALHCLRKGRDQGLEADDVPCLRIS